jgi:hypothetical protein
VIKPLSFGVKFAVCVNEGDRKMSKKISGLFILVGLLLLPVAAKADSTAWDFTSVTAQGTGGTSYAFGVLFTANQSIVVDELGYFNPMSATGQSLMTQTHSVALYNVTTGGIKLDSTTVTNASTPSGNFLYNAVTPVTLIAGDQYELVGVTNTADFYTYSSSVNGINVSGFAISAPITVTGDNENPGTFAGYSPVSNRTDQYFGPDMGYNVTPEPSTLLLLGSGLAGLAGLIKRKLMA